MVPKCKNGRNVMFYGWIYINILIYYTGQQHDKTLDVMNDRNKNLVLYGPPNMKMVEILV